MVSILTMCPHTGATHVIASSKVTMNSVREFITMSSIHSGACRPGWHFILGGKGHSQTVDSDADGGAPRAVVDLGPLSRPESVPLH